VSQADLREVARRAVREEVLRQAWLLFADQGFDATTVDEVAAAAGMSRRTFFRYFSGKDELVLARLVEAGEQIAEALAARPEDETPWQALRRAFDSVLEAQEAQPDRARTVSRMLRDEASARASMEERRRVWLETLVPLVQQRLPRRKDAAIAAEALASAAIACLDTAQAAWTEGGADRMAAALDAAMGAVGPLG